MESGVEQSVVVVPGYPGQPLLVGAQTAVPVFPQVVCGKRTKRCTTVQMDDIDHLDSVVDGEHFMRAVFSIWKANGAEGDTATGL